MTTQYEAALTAIHHLLTATGQSHWAAWIAEDIRSWREERDTSHHLAAYGGMGSFNDVPVLSATAQATDEPIEVWLNVTFGWLRSLCYTLAKQPQRTFTARELARLLGRLDAPLAGFIGGGDATHDMRGFAEAGADLSGWRCLRCGYSEVSPRAVEVYLADLAVPERIFAATERGQLSRVVDETLNGKSFLPPNASKEMTIAIEASRIVVKERNGWLRPCPVCRSDNTAVYRWHRDADGRFQPSQLNLPLET